MDIKNTLPFIKKITHVEGLKEKLKAFNNYFGQDLVEHKDSYVIQIDLSRFNRNEISISAFENKITVAAKKRMITLDYLEEFKFLNLSKYEKFEETFFFDSYIEVSQIYANFYGGILEIYLPKLMSPHLIKIYENESNKNEFNYDDEWPEVSSIHF